MVHDEAAAAADDIDDDDDEALLDVHIKGPFNKKRYFHKNVHFNVKYISTSMALS